MSVLAIGITHESEGFAASIVSDAADRKSISAELLREFDMVFDEVLIVNGDEVIDHWREGGE